MSRKMALSCLVVLAGCAHAAAHKCTSGDDCKYWGCGNRGSRGETCRRFDKTEWELRYCYEDTDCHCYFRDESDDDYHNLLCPEPLFLVVAPLGTLLFFFIIFAIGLFSRIYEVFFIIPGCFLMCLGPFCVR